MREIPGTISLQGATAMKHYFITALVSATTTLCLFQAVPSRVDELEVNRLTVRDELIVSDTGNPWEKGFEEQMIPRGIYARGGGLGESGLWVRGRLIMSEVDDPFDLRFHGIYSDGAIHRAPGHISWNCWIDHAWRQMALIQGEGLEYSEVPLSEWSGHNHPGRLRFQTFRPHHNEPLTDAILGQGKMSIGGGGYGGGGLPYPARVLQLYGGTIEEHPLMMPQAPEVVADDHSGEHRYAIIAIGPQGLRTAASPPVVAAGYATLRWDSTTGADAYLVMRDDKPITGPLRIEGSRKQWTDPQSQAK
jgi:hypothetical protein